MDADSPEELSVDTAKKAYHRRAAEIHPDKADPADLNQVQKFTAAFQELGNYYQRILKYIVDKLKNHDEETDKPLNEDQYLQKKTLTDSISLLKIQAALLY